jgi:hypothetical protein
MNIRQAFVTPLSSSLSVRPVTGALGAELIGADQQPHFQCLYRWPLGTVGIWDNRCTQHYAFDSYDDQRVIERVIALGDRPTGGTPRCAPFVFDRNAASDAVAGPERRVIDTDARISSNQPQEG